MVGKLDDIKRLILQKEKNNKDLRVPAALALFLESIEKVQLQRNEKYSEENVLLAWNHWKSEHLK